jgi:ADP-ribosylation factor protein 1
MVGARCSATIQVGLDYAGKTTILYRLQLGEVVTTLPTIGYSVETINYRNLSLTAWDLCAQESMRPLVRHCACAASTYRPVFAEDKKIECRTGYENVKIQAVIFVVDSTDLDRLDEARCEMQHVLTEEVLAGVPILVYANKQDLPNAMSTNTLINALGLPGKHGHEWHVEASRNARDVEAPSSLCLMQAASAITAEGLYEGLDWLHDALTRRKTWL